MYNIVILYIYIALFWPKYCKTVKDTFVQQKLLQNVVSPTQSRNQPES